MIIQQPTEYAVINKFIQKVFDYYNGRINIFNPARLIIEWCGKYKYQSEDAGHSRLPNLVIINPNVILRNAEDLPNFKYYIIETVIHELYHTDQIISFSAIATDANYTAAMESATEIQTIIYIANHLPEIGTLFGIEIDLGGAVERHLARYDAFHFPYHRRHYPDHLYMILDESTKAAPEDRQALLNICRAYFDDPEKSIKATINNRKLIIKDHAHIAPITAFNDFFYYNFFQYDHNRGVFTTVDPRKKVLDISITTKLQLNDMVIY